MSDISAITVNNLVKSVATQEGELTILNGINMAVMSKKTSNVTMTAKQEEQCFCQFIEDFLNLSFTKCQDKYQNLLLLISLPQLMHGTFISQGMQKKVLAKVKDKLSNLDDPQKEAILVLLDQQPKPKEQKKIVVNKN